MKAYIVLENGQIFEGTRFGAAGDAVGELVFTTGMGGYIETLTDPNYYGQIVVQTFPLIGNYGMIPADMEGEKSFVSGYIIRDLCEAPSNFRCESDLDSFLKAQNIPGIYGVDTRELTRIIRENGVMNAKIVSALPENEKKIDYAVTDAVKSVSTGKEAFFRAENAGYRVALLDLGTKHNFVQELTDRGCDVTVLPYDTAPSALRGFDALLLSDGPGDPAENTQVIENVRSIFGGMPVFAVGLGHQILALACGAKTAKLKYGHRGANQPVRDKESGRVYISVQNHGYTVVSDSLPAGAKERFVNANDETCEGVEYADQKAFSVQFHPQACAGAKNSNFLFDKFIQMIGD